MKSSKIFFLLFAILLTSCFPIYYGNPNRNNLANLPEQITRAILQEAIRIHLKKIEKLNLQKKLFLWDVDPKNMLMKLFLKKKFYACGKHKQCNKSNCEIQK